MAPLVCGDVTRVRPHVIQALGGEQAQGSVSLLYALGFELRRAVPSVRGQLCPALVHEDVGGRVGFGKGPGQCEVLQVPGATAGDGDILTLSGVDLGPGGERVELRCERDVVVIWKKNKRLALSCERKDLTNSSVSWTQKQHMVFVKESEDLSEVFSLRNLSSNK